MTSWLPVQFHDTANLAAELEDWQVYAVNVAPLLDAARENPGGLNAEWQMGARSLSFHLFADDIRSPKYRLLEAGPKGVQQLPAGANKTYGGRTSGGGMRLTLDENFIFGYWTESGTTWFVQPLRDFSPGANPALFVVYETADVKPVPNARCGWTHTEHMRHRAESGQAQAKMVGQCYETEIAIASDFLMFQFFGSVAAAESFTLGVLNNVQTVFDNEFADEIRFVAVANYISSCSTCDPWTPSTLANNLLVSFRDWGNLGGFGVGFDVASLWTNRDFDGNVIGLAWIGALCAGNRYNVLQRFSFNAELLRNLQAHELGHNFNSNHDPDGSSTIMAPAINNFPVWSANSVNVINNYINFVAATGACFSGCGSSGPTPPSAQIQLPVTHVCPGSVVPIIDASTGNPTTWSWSLFGAIPSSSPQQNPVVVYNNPGVFPVQLTVSNFAGSDTHIADQDIVVDQNGQKFLLYETFENDLGAWEVVNPDNNITWQVKEVGGSPYGKKAAWVNHFTYSGSGQVDGLVSPPFSLSGVSSPVLRIDYAYRRRTSTSSEQLRVKLSTNGGATFPHTLFTAQENGNGNFATGGLSSAAFTPAVTNDWCYAGNPGPATCLQINLSPYIGNDNVRILIESVNAGNNNLYVDNVRVEVDCIAIEPPVAVIGAQPVTGCAPLTVSFQDNSLGVVESRIWNFSGGNPSTSTSAFPVVTYAQPGTYGVALEVFNGAGSSLSVQSSLIQVNTSPVADFSFTVNGNTVQFNNLSQGLGSFLWEFGNGQTSIQANPTYTYPQAGTYTVRLTVSNDCGQTVKERLVTIVAPPTAAFSATPTSGCVPLTVQFSNTSAGNPGSLQWDFPGGNPASSTAANPIVTYSNPGAYNVRLIARSGNLADTLVIANFITAGQGPAANFSYTYATGQTSAVFTNTSTNADSIRWNAAGQSSTEHSPIFNFPADGDYTVLLIAFNACGSDTATQTITIVTPPQAGFQFNAGAGCAPATVQFAAAASANTTSYAWSFPGGSPAASASANPVVTYALPGAYTVTLVVGNAAGFDTLAQSVVIGAGPAADFTFAVNGSSVQFNAVTSAADTYAWDFGDGGSSSASSPLHSYAADGQYTVTLTVTNACGTTQATHPVTINSALPTVDFSVAAREGCSPFSIQFQNLSSSNAESYLWSFPGGNPAGSTLPNPVVTYAQPGVYTVSLTATNANGGASITRMDYIQVLPPPQAGFGFHIDERTVAFVNTSTQATSHLWDFGDGQTSTEEHPEHEYAGTGEYEVTLIAAGPCGADTIQRTVSIAGAAPIAGFGADMSHGCAPLTVTFSDHSAGYVSSRQWFFEGGTPSSSSDSTPVITYNQPGSYAVTLIAGNAFGIDTFTAASAVTVSGPPVPGFMFSIDGGTVSFQPVSGLLQGLEFHWDFGDGTASDAYAPAHMYASNGAYMVTLEVSGACGAVVSTQQVEVVVNAVQENGPAGFFRLFPNPASTMVIVEAQGLPASFDSENLRIRFIDATGRFVSRRPLNVAGGKVRQEIQVADWPAGVYFYVIDPGADAGAIYRGKLVVGQ